MNDPKVRYLWTSDKRVLAHLPGNPEVFCFITDENPVPFHATEFDPTDADLPDFGADAPRILKAMRDAQSCGMRPDDPRFHKKDPNA